MNKPIVKYQKSKYNYIRVGKNAYVRLADTDYEEVASTSTVLHYDEISGTFETKNTFYMLETYE